jgi:hypothetical protein
MISCRNVNLQNITVLSLLFLLTSVLIGVCFLDLFLRILRIPIVEYVTKYTFIVGAAGVLLVLSLNYYSFCKTFF